MTAVPMIQIEGRSIPEWIGKTPDEAIPDKVRLRTLLRYGRVCQLTGIPIRPGDNWDADHIKRLKDRGEHRESNLWPVLRGAHQIKSAAEQSEGAHIDRMTKRAYGISESKSKIAKRPKAPRTERPRVPGPTAFARQIRNI